MSNPSIGPKFWAWSNILGIDKGNKFQPSKKKSENNEIKNTWKCSILLLVQNVGHGKNFFDIQMTARAICPVQNWPKTIMAKEKSIGHQKAKFLRNHSFVTSAKDWVEWSRKLPVLLTFSNVWMVSK